MTEEQDKELREWLAEYATSNQGDSYYVVTPDDVYDYEIEQLRALITAHTNAEIARVLDRLESNKETLYWWTGGEYDKTTAVDMRAIQAERAKLRGGVQNELPHEEVE